MDHSQTTNTKDLDINGNEITQPLSGQSPKSTSLDPAVNPNTVHPRSSTSQSRKPSPSLLTAPENSPKQLEDIPDSRPFEKPEAKKEDEVAGEADKVHENFVTYSDPFEEIEWEDEVAGETDKVHAISATYSDSSEEIDW